MSQQKIPNQGVVKQDWVATGRIDFATRLNGDPADADQPSEFKLLVEERRIVESIAGNERSVRGALGRPTWPKHAHTIMPRWGCDSTCTL
jgi:hypothetical protein